MSEEVSGTGYTRYNVFGPAKEPLILSPEAALGKDMVQQPSGIWAKPVPLPSTYDAFTSWTIPLPSYFANYFSPWATDSTPSEPTEIDKTREEPFIGWKTLQIRQHKGKYVLWGGGSTPYAVNGYARCNTFPNEPHTKHKPPVWNCSCGFYALAEKPQQPEYGTFLAQVELFGKVIEGDQGWRAQRQRVLSLEVFRDCGHQVQSKKHDATGFTLSLDGIVTPMCQEHSFGTKTLAELSALMGTEVRWKQ